MTQRFRSILASALATLVVGACVWPNSVAAQRSAPSLRFVSAPQYTLGIAGKGWPATALLIATTRSGSHSVTVSFRSTATGVFLIGLTHVDRCSGVAIVVHDALHHRARLHTPPLECPSRLNPPIPTVVVLEGTQIPSSVATQTTPGWKQYRNTHVGYSVEYPASWSVNERPTANSGMTTVFSPPSGGGGFAVIVSTGTDTVNESDIPNTRCQQVQVGPLTGTRCFDTLSFNTVVTVVGHGKTFTLMGGGKRSIPAGYEHFVQSFRVIGTA